MHKTMKISGLLWALLFAVGGVEAAGLGRLSVQSALGQPLKAEIELLSVNKDELPGITAGLAGADAFRQARIDRISALTALRFSVDQRANGQPIIRVSSNVPIADPFLDLLIEVNWNSGRLLREYTILLDPPVEARPAPVQTMALPEVARPAQTPLAAAPERRAPMESARPKAPEPAPVRQPKRYGPVKSGETLRGIAAQVKPDSVTLEQMMVGLYQANRDAFYADNVNRLKRGQVLNVPEAETVHLQVSPAQAARTLRGHAEDWHAYRRKVADMADEVPTARAPEPATGKLAPRVEDKAPPAAAPRDMLKLSKGEPGGVGRPDTRTQEKLQSLEEELAAKGRALQEAQDRVGQLERTVRDMQKLLELRAQEVGKAPPVAAPAPVEPVPPPESAEMEAAPVAPPAPVAPQVKPKPAPAAVPVAVEPTGASWISTFISNPLYIGGLVAAVLLSVLLWMMMVGSRRRHGLNKFEDSIMTGGEFKNNAVFSTAVPASKAGNGANTEGSMLLTDFSRLGLGAIDTHEVDPIAEAEVYMAYGRDAQAEEILKEALHKDPSRHEIALKLLEIYAARKDSMSFETVASELYAGLGGQGPVWQRAAEMGRSIDPSNPLYRATASEMPSSVSSMAGKVAGGHAMAGAATAAAQREEFPPEMAQADDWGDAPHLMGIEEDVEVPAAAPTDYTPREGASSQRYAPSREEPSADEQATAPDEHDFALEFESATPARAEPTEAEPVEDMSWEEAPASAASEAPMDAPLSSDFDFETTGEAPTLREGADLEEMAFEATPVSEESLEPVEEHEAMPVLDLSDIDLELESEPAAAEAIDEFAPDMAAESMPEPENEPVDERGEPEIDLQTAAEPVVEPLAADLEPEPEIIESVDEFAPDLAAEFTPEPEIEPAAPEVEVQPEMAASEAAPEVAAESGEAPAETVDPELWEEVNTKLDLARAYLEMGDQEGAREILQEVLGEGDAQQKADADKLLAEAG